MTLHRCLVVCLLLAAGAAQAQVRAVVNLFALVDAPEGGVWVLSYPSAPVSQADDSWTWAENGTRVWVAFEMEAEGGPWYSARFTIVDDYLHTAEEGATVWGYAHGSSLQMAAPVRPSTGSVRGAGVASEMHDVFSEPLWLTVGSDDGYLNLRAGPSTSHPVLVAIPDGAEVLLEACAPKPVGARGRWCLAGYEAEMDCDDGPYCPGPVFYGYLYSAELFVSCNLQDAPSDRADPCYGRVGRRGPPFE